MARKQRGEESGESWLNTYADMVTLLLTFFVVMLSMSVIEAEKFDVLVKSLTPGTEKGVANPGDASTPIELPPDAEMSMDDLYQQLQQHVQDEGMQDAMSVSQEGDIVYIRFNSSMLFEPDRYILLQNSGDILDFVGRALKLYEQRIKTINVCGHTARTGRINEEVSDWRLSGERAATVAMYFEDNSAIDKSKMIIFGYGDNYPIEDNATEAGRSQNRRVELVVVGTESMANFDVYGVLNGVYEDGGPGNVLTPRGGEPGAN